MSRGIYIMAKSDQNQNTRQDGKAAPHPSFRLVTAAEAEFIATRALEHKIDVVGRLQWLEDALTMIANGKRSLR